MNVIAWEGGGGYTAKEAVGNHMDKVHKPYDSECYTPPSESNRLYSQWETYLPMVESYKHMCVSLEANA
jgi:hypothetical protein